MSGKQFLFMIVGMVVIVPVAQFVGRAAAEHQNEREALDADKRERTSIRPVTEPSVVAVITSQDAEGVTEADFSPEFLEFLGDWVVTRTSFNAQRHWDSARVPVQERKISPESVYVEVGLAQAGGDTVENGPEYAECNSCRSCR